MFIFADERKGWFFVGIAFACLLFASAVLFWILFSEYNDRRELELYMKQEEKERLEYYQRLHDYYASGRARSELERFREQISASK